ncbi:putative transcriptional regulator [Mycobacteroides stephanolepidis]|uniref:Putative transcriptional regulator n=1 Tax=[Mycobacterium] stephanolepidis TaxID=1520670 RepID=A0A1Z4ER41_9MYCO|nr:TetR/AcrR family transcriptional regulator [[Mycobacterium] stephanolepidis]BAX95430.1 putative transcriptional regulator [[Mycobacterium] stephanolepidis]
MTTPEATDTKPVGKEEVVEAVLNAAAELFAEKGPAAASIREVAARAGVNHGLVHRHFGSKRQLLASTLQHLADTGAALRETGASPSDLEAAHDLQLRVMVRSTLDGFPIEELQERRPGMEWLLEQIRPGHADEREARLAGAHAIALQLGWRLMGPSLRAGFGLDDMSDADIRAEVAGQVAKLITPQ